jgi:hypothetical protein
MIKRMDLDRHALSLGRGLSAGVHHWPHRSLFVKMPGFVNSTTTNRTSDPGQGVT